MNVKISTTIKKGKGKAEKIHKEINSEEFEEKITELGGKFMQATRQIVIVV